MPKAKDKTKQNKQIKIDRNNYTKKEIRTHNERDFLTSRHELTLNGLKSC